MVVVCGNKEKKLHPRSLGIKYPKCGRKAEEGRGESKSGQSPKSLSSHQKFMGHLMRGRGKWGVKGFSRIQLIPLGHYLPNVPEDSGE